MLVPVILSAGLSSRMGREKLTLPLNGATVFGRSASLVESLFNTDIVNVYKEGLNTFLSLKDTHHNILNPSPERGIASSVVLAIQYIHNHIDGCDGALFFLADEPFIEKETVERVVETFMDHKDSIVLPRYNGVPGHPVAFGKVWFGELAKLTGDNGGRSIIRKNPQNVIYVPGGKGCIEDIDTLKEYERLVQNGFKIQ